jgi:hypothetical protein
MVARGSNAQGSRRAKDSNALDASILAKDANAAAPIGARVAPTVSARLARFAAQTASPSDAQGAAVGAAVGLAGSPELSARSRGAALDARVAQLGAASPAPRIQPPVRLPVARTPRPQVMTAIEIGEISVEIGAGEPPRPQALHQPAAGALIAAIPAMRLTRSRR